MVSNFSGVDTAYIRKNLETRLGVNDYARTTIARLVDALDHEATVRTMLGQQLEDQMKLSRYFARIPEGEEGNYIDATSRTGGEDVRVRRDLLNIGGENAGRYDPIERFVHGPRESGMVSIKAGNTEMLYHAPGLDAFSVMATLEAAYVKEQEAVKQTQPQTRQVLRCPETHPVLSYHSNGTPRCGKR